MNNGRERFIREEMLIGGDALERLKNSKVMLFGVGGVGSYAAEALARSGVGTILLVDNDNVSRSNINRQLCALESTVGRPKVDVVSERLRDINPDINVICISLFVLPENISELPFDGCDYIIDAVDTVSAKLAIAERATELSVPMISCMGTGNKLDPSALKISDISKTSGCPLARVMRRELRQRGIMHLPVIYSEEKPISPLFDPDSEKKKATPGSISFVPSVAGLMAASAAVKKIIGVE